MYLQSGKEATLKQTREHYSSEVLPQLLINCKLSGVVGGDWNSIIEKRDSLKNAEQKMSPSLKRLVKTFEWSDCYRSLYPIKSVFSRYYSSEKYGPGATRIDRAYSWGILVVVEAKYEGVAFSDHMALIVKVKVPDDFSKLLSPKFRPQFKARPDVVTDKEFKKRLKAEFACW